MPVSRAREPTLPICFQKDDEKAITSLWNLLPVKGKNTRRSGRPRVSLRHSAIPARTGYRGTSLTINLFFCCLTERPMPIWEISYKARR
ncbi:hypothetical protein KCP74_25215 [Salmonella enterica subsp. enterica]|nr:hypothetical protein KCP74_25215 [Salmonella enterica subsp. enterica]